MSGRRMSEKPHVEGFLLHHRNGVPSGEGGKDLHPLLGEFLLEGLHKLMLIVYNQYPYHLSYLAPLLSGVTGRVTTKMLPLSQNALH